MGGDGPMLLESSSVRELILQWSLLTLWNRPCGNGAAQ